MKELKSSVGLGGKPGDGGEEVEDQDFKSSSKILKEINNCHD